MQTPTRLLVKVNIEKLADYRNINLSTFGAEPKISTGYRLGGFVAIPIKHLLRDGFSFAYEPEWYEKGSKLINNEPCYLFSNNEVDVLTS